MNFAGCIALVLILWTVHFVPAVNTLLRFGELFCVPAVHAFLPDFVIYFNLSSLWTLHLFHFVNYYCVYLVGFTLATPFLFNTNCQCYFYVVFDWCETTRPNISTQATPIAGPSGPDIRWRLVACLLCITLNFFATT